MKALRTLKDLSYDPIEIKVREATNNDPIGASSTLMADIAQSTHNYRLYAKLYAMLWKRLCDLEHILHVQKALILVEYLLRNGHERFLNDCKKNSRDIVRLTKYKYYNKDHEDIAHDVRFKAAIVTDLLSNPEKLAAERKKAESMRGIRLQAVSHEDAHKQVESQWSSVEREKQEKAQKEQAAKAQAARKAAAARAAAAKQAEAEPEDEPAADDEPEGPAGEASIEDDPFGAAPADPEPAAAAKPAAAKKAAAPAAKKPVAATAAAKKPQQKQPEPEPEDDDEPAVRRPSGADDDPAFGAAIHAEAVAAPKPAGGQSRAAPQVAAAQAARPVQPTAAAIEDPFNIFDVGMSGAAKPAAAPAGGDHVDLLTSSFGAASVSGGFVDVPARKPATPAPAPVRGQSNVDPVAAPAKPAANDIWGMEGLVNTDDITRAGPRKDDKKSGPAGVSMGEMNQLKQGLGGNDLLAGFGGPAAPVAQPNPHARPSAGAGAGAGFNLANNPFFAPGPSSSPFQGMNGGAAKPKPAAGAAASSPFADLGFG